MILRGLRVGIKEMTHEKSHDWINIMQRAMRNDKYFSSLWSNLHPLKKFPQPAL